MISDLRKLSADDVALIRAAGPTVSSRSIARLLQMSHTVVVKARNLHTYKVRAGEPGRPR